MGSPSSMLQTVKLSSGVTDFFEMIAMLIESCNLVSLNGSFQSHQWARVTNLSCTLCQLQTKVNVKKRLIFLDLTNYLP